MATYYPFPVHGSCRGRSFGKRIESRPLTSPKKLAEEAMPTRAEYFRARAAECEEKAKAAKDPEAKRMLLEAAKHWREMADQSERLRW